MNINKRLFACLGLWLFFFVACSSAPHAAPTLTTLNGSQGGMIVYGVVDGATSQPAALGSVLRNVHNGCGEKPQVGRVFRVRGTNSDAVFFTVVNHPQGNVQVAGMIIASQTGPKTVEAAMVSDAAARFNSTVNPLLNQLFSVWHPGGTPAAGGGAPSAGSAPASAPAGGGGGALPPMQQVTLPDNTATFSLPAGWRVDPQWEKGGSSMVHGPQGETVWLNLRFGAQDPRSQVYQYQLRLNGGRPLPHLIVYPANADLAKSFADIFQQMRINSPGGHQVPLNVERVEPISGSQGQCVDATGQFNPDGQGMQELGVMLCRSQPDQYGAYHIDFSQYNAPPGSTDQQRVIGKAIIASFRMNEQLVQARATADAAPFINQMNQKYQAQQQAMIANGQRIVGNINQIGANATARMNATEAANQRQWAGFDQQENNISRQGQGFSNYLLDQSVVQNNNVNGTGMVGHATVWNSQADAMVKSNPNKYEIVNTPNYWNGVDY